MGEQERRVCVQRAVRTVLIVARLVLEQDPPQMVLIPDQSTVRELLDQSLIVNEQIWASDDLITSLDKLARAGRVLCPGTAPE